MIKQDVAGKQLCNLFTSQLNTTAWSQVTIPETNRFPLGAGKFDDTKQNHMTRALEHTTCPVMQEQSVGHVGEAKYSLRTGVLVCLFHM